MKRTAQRDDKQHGRYWSVNVIRSTITKGLVTSIVLYTFQFTIWDFWFGHNYATTTCQTRFCTFVYCNTVYVFWVFRPYLFFFSWLSLLTICSVPPLEFFVFLTFFLADWIFFFFQIFCSKFSVIDFASWPFTKKQENLSWLHSWGSD